MALLGDLAMETSFDSEKVVSFAIWPSFGTLIVILEGKQYFKLKPAEWCELSFRKDFFALICIKQMTGETPEVSSDKSKGRYPQDKVKTEKVAVDLYWDIINIRAPVGANKLDPGCFGNSKLLYFGALL